MSKRQGDVAMENLMMLQKQFLKPIKIMLPVVDVLWAILIIFMIMAGETEFVLYEFGGILIVILVLHLMLLEARKPSASLKKMSPDVLKVINEQCLTGLRLGNGILCDNDCLVFVGLTVTAVRLQDVTRLELRTTTKGQITVYGMRISNVGGYDPMVPLAMRFFLWKNNSDYQVINGANRRVRGIGAFREADRDSFWRELCDAWKKYTDTEPIVI